MRERCVGEDLPIERELVTVKAVRPFKVDARTRQYIRQVTELDQAFIQGERPRHLRGHIRCSHLGLLRLALGAQAEHVDLVLQLWVREMNARQRESALEFHSLRNAFSAGADVQLRFGTDGPSHEGTVVFYGEIEKILHLTVKDGDV